MVSQIVTLSIFDTEPAYIPTCSDWDARVLEGDPSAGEQGARAEWVEAGRRGMLGPSRQDFTLEDAVKIAVNRAKCIAAANCIGIAEKTFKLDGDRKAVVLDPKAHDDQTIYEAAESCPTEAIVLYDEESGEQIFP